MTNDAMTNDAMTNDTMTNDAMTNDAMTNDAMTNDQFIADIGKLLSKKSPTYIKVRITSKCPKNEIYDQMDDGTYKIRIKAQPVKGQANAELIKFLKKGLGASEVAIVSGGRDKVKLIRLTK